MSDEWERRRPLRSRPEVPGWQCRNVCRWRHDGDNTQVVPDPDEEQPLAKLWYAVPDGVEYCVSHLVSACGQICSSVIGDVSSCDRQHARHVLHHDSERPPKLRCVKKANVQVVARIGFV